MSKIGSKQTAVILTSLIFLFALAYLSLRQPVHTTDLPATFSRLDSSLEIEDWEYASYSMQEFKEKWNRVRMRILLNAGFDSLLLFESAMARLEKAIRQEALLEAQLELAEIQIIWREFITF